MEGVAVLERGLEWVVTVNRERVEVRTLVNALLERFICC